MLDGWHPNADSCIGRLYPDRRHRRRKGVELVADDRFELTRDARDIELEFSDLSFAVAEFYSLLGFPDCPAERAASDAEADAASPVEIDMWTLHSDATYASTSSFQGKEGASHDGYVRIANDTLFSSRGHHRYAACAGTRSGSG